MIGPSNSQILRVENTANAGVISVIFLSQHMCKIFAVEYIHTLGLHQRLCSSLLSQFQKSYQLNQQNWLGC